MFLGSKVVGDGPSNLTGWMQCSVEVNLDCTSKVSGFLMIFLKIKHIALRHCFWEIVYAWKLYFPKTSCVVTLMYIIVYEKLFRICYCIWGNAWFVSMEKIKFFYLILGNGFCRLIALFAKFKDASIFGKIDTKSSWQEMSHLRILWIFWVFQKFLWNYLKLKCVLISCKLWALYVFTLELRHVITRWLPS